MSLKYEPSSESLHSAAKWLFLNPKPSSRLLSPLEVHFTPSSRIPYLISNPELDQNLYGNKVYCTACFFLAKLKNSYGKLHCQKGFDSIPFSHKIRQPCASNELWSMPWNTRSGIHRSCVTGHRPEHGLVVISRSFWRTPYFGRASHSISGVRPDNTLVFACILKTPIFGRQVQYQVFLLLHLERARRVECRR